MADYPYLDSLNTDGVSYNDPDEPNPFYPEEDTDSPKTDASAYTFDNYQEDTRTTAIYPEAGNNTIGAIDYCIFGLIGEAGEIANKWKKFHRDGYNESIKADVIKELGDVLWYASQLATELEVRLSDIAADNIRKLTSRKQRNKLGGSGDDR